MSPWPAEAASMSGVQSPFAPRSSTFVRIASSTSPSNPPLDDEAEEGGRRRENLGQLVVAGGAGEGEEALALLDDGGGSGSGGARGEEDALPLGPVRVAGGRGRGGGRVGRVGRGQGRLEGRRLLLGHGCHGAGIGGLEEGRER